MPPERSTRSDPAGEAVAEDEIVAVAERTDQVVEPAEVVRVVRVAHDDDLAARLREPAEVGVAVAAASLVDHLGPRSGSQLGRTVGRAIVDDDHFEVGKNLARQRSQAAWENPLTIPVDDYYRNKGRVRHFPETWESRAVCTELGVSCSRTAN